MPAILLTFLGVAMVIGGVTYFVRAMRTRAWPTVEGRVIQREVRETPNPAADRWAAYEPVVTYVYEVAGKRHEGHALYVTLRFYPEPDARALVDSLPDPVQVRYDPANPANAVLFNDAYFWPVAFTLAGLLTTLLGLAFALSGHPLPTA